jgi:hypothetical protein
MTAPICRLAERIANANKTPIPAGITKATYALMREHLRAIKPVGQRRGVVGN